MDALGMSIITRIEVHVWFWSAACAALHKPDSVQNGPRINTHVHPKGAALWLYCMLCRQVPACSHN